MDLKNGYPNWAVRNGPMLAFPQLAADLSCDVVVIRTDITDAQIARCPHSLTTLFSFVWQGYQ